MSYIDSKGYRVIRVDGRRRLEHRMVWELEHGAIPGGCIIHHRNGARLDNEIENLECMTRAEHVAHHQAEIQLCRGEPWNKGTGEMASLLCVRCGEAFQRPAFRQKQSDRLGYAGPFCGLGCSTVYANEAKHCDAAKEGE